MQFFVTSYVDILEHSAAVIGWRQTYDQLECGRPHSTLTQLCGDGYQMFLERIDKRVVQRGISPDGRLCIGIAWQGATFDPADWAGAPGVCRVALLRNGEPFNLHMPAGASILAVNLDYRLFRTQAQTCLDDSQLREIDEASSIDVPMSVLSRVAVSLQDVLQQVARRHDETPGSTGDNELAERVMSAFMELFGGERRDQTGRSRSLAVSNWLVKRSEELLFDQMATRLTVTDLCTRLKVSRRTLQYSFHAVTGTSPVEYLRGLRLNAARRRLTSTPSDSLRVGDIAAEVGFDHLSYFARHYRDMFGELPSHTRRFRGVTAPQGIQQH